MFDIDSFVADCRAALAERSSEAGYTVTSSAAPSRSPTRS